MGHSRVYTGRKHGRPLAIAGALGSALLQLANPVTALSSRKRAKQVAFLRGVLEARTKYRPPTQR